MICLAFPTIMSGLVLRWYADESGYQAGRELASAGREAAMIEPECPESICRLADAAHDYIRDCYARSFHARPDVSRWVTHVHVGGILSDKIAPISAQPARFGGAES